VTSKFELQTSKLTRARPGSGDRRDLVSGALTRFNRAIHVALPFHARVFTRERHAPERPGQPVAPVWLESGIEVRVAAAGPGIVAPVDGDRRDEPRRLAEPGQSTADAISALTFEDLGHRV